MGIKYLENERIFKLDTPNTSYVCAIVEGYLMHAYYGSRISDDDIRYRLRIYEEPFTPSKNNRDKGHFLDTDYFEYPAEGLGDFRSGCLRLETMGGHVGCQPIYVNHRIYEGKEDIPGLPATYGDQENCESLEISLSDELTGLVTTLVYTVFDGLDAIIKSVRIKNEGRDIVYIKSALSSCLDMDNDDYEILTLNGAWTRERRIDRSGIGYGKLEVGSTRGESSQQTHPFIAVTSGSADCTRGDVYGFNFIYSGNFTASVERTHYDSLRILMGINPKGFSWKLNPGETFYTPEAVSVYSAVGFDHMTHTFHDLYREHLICGACRGNKYKDSSRPILINNWEATYFDFDSDKLIAIAKEAAKSGIEMLVMDDGWFGNRSCDDMALGDWYVNEDKLKGGLKKLTDAVNEAGLKFGIWIEPEMVSPDSDLYRAHPDWAIAIPGRKGTLLRNQYVLDFSRKEIVDEIYSRIKAVLSSANIEYVKWDMNRNLTDIGSYALEADRQGELFHRYVLGVYDMQARLLKDFPDLLIENCSAGGARFDPGMLYFSPQIWCSDDTDAIERLAIQEGTSIVYPLSCMGAHISDCPNHLTSRTVPFETRGYVALAGTFGYELDITRIDKKDRDMIPAQVAMYHKYNSLVREGDYYRISSYRQNHQNDCWMVVSKDKKRALVTYIKVLARPNYRSTCIKLSGLDPKASYRVACDKKVLSLDHDKAGDLILHGDTLMSAGLLIDENIDDLKGDFRGVLIELTAV